MARKKTTPIPEEQELLEQIPTAEDTAPDSDAEPTIPAETIAEDQPETDASPQDATEDPDDLPAPEQTPVEGDAAEEPLGEEAPRQEDSLPAEEPIPKEHTAKSDAEPEASYDAILDELGGIPSAEESMDGEPMDEGPEQEQADNADDGYSADDLLLLTGEETEREPVVKPEQDTHDITNRTVEAPLSAAALRRRERVLTIDAHGEVETEEDREATAWHEIQNAYRTRRILTGTLDGVEKTPSGLTLAIVSYNGFRVAIPIKEMLLHTGKVPNGPEFMEWMTRMSRMLMARLGSEVDFIVKGIHNDSRSIVASRRDAMYRKRQIFYMDTDEFGEHMIYEGRVVQARVVAVAEKVIRVEVFGVECSIVARNLSWEWMGNARDHYNVGDRILVRILRVSRPQVERISIQVDVRSVSSTTSHENLKKCLPQCRYVGRITDVRNGVIFIRLNNGVNAIAHSCYDLRTPGKKDDVSFAVTRLDEEQGVAVGIITRIIKQNL